MPPTSQHPSPDDPATRSWLSVVRAYHLCSELMGMRLAELGVRTAEHEILANLGRQPDLNQQALAARCFTAKSHVSGLLNEMEAKGWITRQADPSDGRAKRLTLTAAGAAMATLTAAVQTEVVALMTEGATHTELLHMARTMSDVSKRLEAALGRAREVA